MKRLFVPFILVACLTLSANAQKTEKPFADIKSLTFCGVDFSKGRIYASTDSPDKLRNAYKEINQLFINEPIKYDIAELTGKAVNDVRINAVNDLNENISDESIKTMSSNYIVSDEDINSTLRELNLDGLSGVGLVVVAQHLSKTKNIASYVMVFFDIESRNVITKFTLTGKPGGAGVRNYWASSVHEAMKKIKKYKE